MKVPILVPRIFNYPLTYESGSLKNLKPGEFVSVPFGKVTEIGVVWDKIEKTTKNFKLKKIDKKLSHLQINPNLIGFINWFASYNLISKGIVLKMFLGNKSNLTKIEENKSSEIIAISKDFKFNIEQKKSFNDLKSYGNKFSVSMLQGITGSGKTLVYFERIKEVLNIGSQVLILLPEIFLTNQFEERFIKHFGFTPAVWHSKIGVKAKRKIWQGIINKNVNLVIGARSSLLLPFKKLGLIVVDEEHDSSYKQDEGAIYHARDMAISRANFENIPIYLISSVPSLETYNNIKNKKYNHTRILKRYSDFPLPEAKVVNLKFSKLKKDSFIAQETIKFVNEYLDKKEQVLFFLNRRGYAPFLICTKCGYRHTCINCSIYLTYHKSINKVVCHHCGKKKRKHTNVILTINYVNLECMDQVLRKYMRN